jgi:agmatinase
MHGKGKHGRFAGLPDRYFDPQTAKVHILPVPFDLTSTYQKGADLGPAELIEASRNLELYDIETHTEVYKVGIHTAQPILCTTSVEMLQELEKQTAERLAQGKFVAVLGGEHSISQAPIRAHAQAFPGISILHLDAHADLQPAYEGNPLSHASVMSRVREIPSIASTVAVGIRSMSSDELPYIDSENTFWAHEIWQDNHWIDEVIDKLVSSKVYITLDLDVLDPALLPATGTPEPGGIQWYQLMLLLRRVASERTIVGFDIVELCPRPHDHSSNFVAAKLTYKLLSYIYASAPEAKV